MLRLNKSVESKCPIYYYFSFLLIKFKSHNNYRVANSWSYERHDNWVYFWTLGILEVIQGLFLKIGKSKWIHHLSSTRKDLFYGILLVVRFFSKKSSQSEQRNVSCVKMKRVSVANECNFHSRQFLFVRADLISILRESKTLI